MIPDPAAEAAVTAEPANDARLTPADHSSTADQRLRSDTSAWSIVGSVLRGGLLILVALYFVLPLLFLARQSFQSTQLFKLRWEGLFKNWTVDGLRNAAKHPDFGPTLWRSIKLAIGTVLVTQLLLIPTALWVHIRLPKARSVVEFVTLLPYVVPPIALVAGVAAFFRPNAKWFLDSEYSLIPFYVVMALPFTYRAIDAGIRAIDIKTLMDASRSLGGGPLTTLVRVLIPNLRSAIIASSFLTITVVVGEFTIAKSLLRKTFPTFTQEIALNDSAAGFSVALSTLLVSMMALGVLTFLTRSRSQRVAAKAARAAARGTR